MDHSDFHWAECNPSSRTPSHIRRQSTIQNALLSCRPSHLRRPSIPRHHSHTMPIVLAGSSEACSSHPFCLGKIDMTINIVVNTFYPEPSSWTSPQGELSTSLSSQQLPELLHKGVPL